ncbi:hypothetical protein HDV04_003562 [Boothiomyces sp. JEL0838]|nr:hypothetical protein HDV04_003562 [Boothiomyces sp. JEL0838]
MFQFLLFGMVFPKCISITETTVCSPWSNMQIDVDVLSNVYQPKTTLDAKTWEQLLLQSTNTEQKTLWQSWANCSLDDTEVIPYSRSYNCLTDIFVFSKDCNQGKTAPRLEDFVCQRYGNYLHLMEANDNVCPKLNQSSPYYDIMNQRRQSMCQAGDVCKKFLELPNFTGQPKIPGVDTDSSTCGTGTSDAYKKYCSLNPGESCCLNTNSETFSESIAGAMKMWSAVSKTGKGYSDMNSDNIGSILLILVVAAFCILVVGLMVAKLVALKRKNAPTENTYKNLDSQSSKEDTLLTTAQLLYRVRYSYTPQLDDELELVEGDEIEMESIDDKGN